MKRVWFVMLAVLASNYANATDLSSEKLVKVAVSKAYIPQGFDNNDITKVVVEGFFPNTCYRIKKQDATDVKIDRDKNTVEVTQRAYVYSGMCLQMIVPYTETVEIGKLASAGSYRIVDSLSKRELGKMAVDTSTTTGPDDYFYAMVNDAHVSNTDSSEGQIIIRGELPTSCWDITDKKVFLDGKDVLTVLPIMTLVSKDACPSVRVPFETTIALPQLEAGRYLLNVRSLNGQSINKLFDAR